MDDATFGDSVREALDELLVPLGFASGQGQFGQIIYCAGTDDFIRRFGHLVDLEALELSAECVDLVIEGTSGEGISEVRLEGQPLDTAFTSVPRTLLRDRPPERTDAQLTELRGALAELFQLDI